MEMTERKVLNYDDFFNFETFLQQVNGSEFSLPPAFDMKAFKAEILKEMRSEITKAKNEIIDGECHSCHFRANLSRNAICLHDVISNVIQQKEKLF